MDRILTAAMRDDSFGSDWRPGSGGETGKKRETGRRAFFRRGVAAAASALAVSAGRQAFAGNPNYLPSLYLGENVREFEAIQTHENAHVAFLVNALGANARPKPSFVNFTQPNLVTFAQTSRALENTGVGAYLGAAPIIFNSAYLAAAGSILTIEARHSGYINVLLNLIMTENVAGDVVNFDVPLTQDAGRRCRRTIHHQPERRPPLVVLDDALGRKRHRDPELRPGARVPGGGVLQHQRAHLHLRRR